MAHKSNINRDSPAWADISTLFHNKIAPSYPEGVMPALSIAEVGAVI
jgi:hypothetical protein